MFESRLDFGGVWDATDFAACRMKMTRRRKTSTGETMRPRRRGEGTLPLTSNVHRR